MNKIQNLRDYLLANVPSLENNPDRLLVFVDKGQMDSRSQTSSLAFEYVYTAHVILTDFADHADRAMIPVLAWYKLNQPDKSPKDGIRFEADLLNNQSVDLSIKLDLTERVLVTVDAAGVIQAVTHCAEPALDTNTFSWPADLFINGQAPS